MKNTKDSLPSVPLTPMDWERCLDRLHNLMECFRISSLINSSLDIEEVLELIMTTSRQILAAEACSLMLVDEQTGELVFEVAQGPVADKLKRGTRLEKGKGIAGYVFEIGEPLLIEDAYQDARFHPGFDEQTGFRTRSVLCVPLKVKGRMVGVVQIINRRDGLSFCREDCETLTLLSTHAAIAIENARMHRALLRKQQMESDLAFATNVQLSFLPQEVPSVTGFRFHAHYQPALEVGGDFYDFIDLNGGNWGILIGDVSGKGVASALYMAKLTSDFRMLALRHKDPVKLIGYINDLLCRRSRRGMFVTLLYMVLDTAHRRLQYVNAGHVPAVLWNRRRECFQVLRGIGGPPLGILPGRGYPSGTVELSPGDCLLLSTDGLVEAKSPDGRRLGWEEVSEAVRGGDSCAESVLARVSGRMKAFTRGCPQSDDTTLVVFHVVEGA